MICLFSQYETLLQLYCIHRMFRRRVKKTCFKFATNVQVRACCDLDHFKRLFFLTNSKYVRISWGRHLTRHSCHLASYNRRRNAYGFSTSAYLCYYYYYRDANCKRASFFNWLQYCTCCIAIILALEPAWSIGMLMHGSIALMSSLPAFFANCKMQIM